MEVKRGRPTKNPKQNKISVRIDLKVDVEWAIAESRKAALQEGILIGISSGANLWAAREIAKKYPNANIVTFLCDTGERYLSTDLYEVGE